MTTSSKSKRKRAAHGIQPASSSRRFIEVGGLRLHYLDYGAADHPPMLCLHGGMAHAHWYDFVAGDFTDRYQVYSLDLRGHGDSARPAPPDYHFERFAEDVDEFAHRLDLHDFVLVGHSMGGMIALTYAATFPGRAAKLVVVDSAPFVSAESATRLRNFSARDNRSYATLEELVGRYRLQPESKASTEIVRYLGREGARQAADGSWTHKFDRNLYAGRGVWNGFPYWERVRIPALLIKGALSPRITPAIYSAIKGHCAHVELATVAASNHHVMLDNPHGFSQALKGFLDATPP